MNIISNTCLGAYIQRDILHQQYNNPFCWNIIDAKSMLYLIENYDSINFMNYELVKDAKWNFTLIIDKHIYVKYVHYLFSPMDDSPRIHNADVYYNKIWEYIIHKYEERLIRMKENNLKPIFVIGTSWPGNFYTAKEIEMIANANTNYKIIISNNNLHANIKRNNVSYYDNNIKLDNLRLSKEIYEHCILGKHE